MPDLWNAAWAVPHANPLAPSSTKQFEGIAGLDLVPHGPGRRCDLPVNAQRCSAIAASRSMDAASLSLVVERARGNRPSSVSWVQS